jgi:serine/threonine protein kinase
VLLERLWRRKHARRAGGGPRLSRGETQDYSSYAFYSRAARAEPRALDEFPTLPPGTLIAGKLRLIRTLGAGGMGVVYEVEHEITKHHRALKVLHAYAAEQPGVVERFLREASAAGRVGNAHVAETFDAGKLDSGEPYLLMELLDGETLDQLLQRSGPLDAGLLCNLIHQACEGVHAAHEAGIIHRDLKPENLMIVTRDGAPFVKILDFGISKFDAERTGSLKLTTEGLVMGTPYYMSPEQVVGSSTIDARTDIYALGVILYECATGVRPFDAQTVQHLAILIHQGNPVPLATRRAALPSAFYDIVHRAMAADREQRFESARALAAALAPLRGRVSGAPATRIVEPYIARPLVERYIARPLIEPAHTHVVVDTTSGGTPRVTSSRPSGPMPSTDGALAQSMSGRSSAGKRSRALGVSAISLVLVAGAIALAVTRSSRIEPSPPPRPAAAAANVVAEPPQAAVLPAAHPFETAPPASSASPTPSGLPAEAVKRAPPATPSASALAGARTTASSSPPAPTPAQKGRVEDNGLSRENPFR